MTPEQLSALAGVHGGDLVLVTTPEGSTSPLHELSRLLLVDSIRFVGMMTRRTIYICSPGSLQADDWLHFMRGPSQFWRDYQQGRSIADIDTLLSDEDIVLVRPAFDDLFHTIFNGACPFLYCQDGLVTVSSATRVVLRDAAGAARRYGFNMMTLCPFCMGTTLYRDHETLVDGVDYDNPPQNDSEIREEHIGRINARRTELGYRPVTQDTALNNLQLEEDARPVFGGAESAYLNFQDALDANPGAQVEVQPVSLSGGTVTLEAIESAQALGRMINDLRTAPSDELAEDLRHMIEAIAPGLLTSSTSVPTPGALMLALPPAPITAPVQSPGAVVPGLRATEWYIKAAARVLRAECQICLEKFMPSEVVADLPCWHFFHMECWSNVEDGKCPFRCNAETVREVVEEVVQDVVD